MKLLDVCAIVLDRKGQPFCEAEIDNKRLVTVIDGKGKESKKQQHVLTAGDTIKMVERRIGDIIAYALDNVPDEKLTPKQRRERFFLAAKIEDATKRGAPFEMDKDDEKHIDAAADLITNNHMFVARIGEALEAAEHVKPNGDAVRLPPTSKPNGDAAQMSRANT